MEQLSHKQKILIEDLKDDVNYYKEELESQINSQRIYIGVGVVLAIGVSLILIIFPELLFKLKSISEHANTVTGFVGNLLPATFATKSFNMSKIQKKKLKGMRVFERQLTRMEQNILPNSEKDIFEFENDLAIYINT